jgi:hypothetical protein
MQNAENVYYSALKALIPGHQLDGCWEKMNVDFSYIKQHLDGNENAIWEQGEQCTHYNSKKFNIYGRFR